MTNILLCITLVLLVAAIALLIVLLTKKPEQQDDSRVISALHQENILLRQEIADNIRDLGNDNSDDMERLSRVLQAGQSSGQQAIAQELTHLQASLNGQLSLMEQRLQAIEQSSDVRLDTMRKTMAESLSQIRTDTDQKLEQIRSSVDQRLTESLDKRVRESFQLVSERLEQVYQGLGEMKSLASDVGGLKKVLSGVKTSGILGEYQLKAILEQILSPEQYDENVATVPQSTERVEFAIRIPGKDGSFVYLPIDAKFPAERFSKLQEARDSGDRQLLEAAWKELSRFILSQAKDIHQKYISVPHTTAFAVMFLPTEGLYAEVVSHGMIEPLQRDYQVTIAGPSTMAALLNSIEMGFQTLAIEKRSQEVWQVLGAVKTEFDKFEDALLKLQTHIRLSGEDLDQLIGTRSNAIRRKLRDVQRLDMPTAATLLSLDEHTEE